MVFVSCPWEEDCVALSSPSLPSLFCASWAFPRLTPWLLAVRPVPGRAARIPGAFGSRRCYAVRSALTLRKRGASPAGRFCSFLVVIAGSRASWPLFPREGHTCQAWSPRRPGVPGRAFLCRPGRAWLPHTTYLRAVRVGKAGLEGFWVCV